MNRAFDFAAELEKADPSRMPSLCVKRSLELKTLCKNTEPMFVYFRSAKWGTTIYAEPGASSFTIINIINSILLDDEN